MDARRAREDARRRAGELAGRAAELARARDRHRSGRSSGGTVEEAQAAATRAWARGRQAAWRLTLAQEASAAAHDRAADAHTRAADDGVGDVDRHRRRAGHHRRAAESVRREIETPAAGDDVAPQAGAPGGPRRDATLRELRREVRRLRAALTSVVASPGMFGVRNPAVDRRRRLWQQACGVAGSAAWAGWTDALCRRLVAELPGIDAAAISVRTGSVHELVAATTPWAHRVEQLNYTIGEGPAATAYESGVPVLVPELTGSDRWPGYVQAAADQIAAVIVLPLELDGSPIGTLSLYSRQRPELTADHWSDCLIGAELAVPALLVDLDDAPVEFAMSESYHRVAIASGVVSSAQSITLDEATDLLRAHAFASGRPIIDIADDVIDGRVRLDG